jgi:hypothetical protein
MAKTPVTPKAKKDAPAQFDMNSRERKGGGTGGGAVVQAAAVTRSARPVTSSACHPRPSIGAKAGSFRSSARLTRRLTPPRVRNTT